MWRIYGKYCDIYLAKHGRYQDSTKIHAYRAMQRMLELYGL